MIRVLIADDDKEDVEIFHEALTAANHQAELHIVRDGEALLKHLQDDSNGNPDYLFLDLSMPKLSGFECLNQVRRNGEYDDVKIIILSDSVSVGEIDDAYDLGANYFITKPSKIEAFRELLRFVLSDSTVNKPSRAEFVLREGAAALDK